jgi:hypothetical protein
MKWEGCTVCIEDRKNVNTIFVSLKGRDHFEDGELKEDSIRMDLQ